jgi:tRNA(adenine34) deaminase
MTSHEDWMAEAIRAARCAEAMGEVPVGAVVVLDGELVASGHNQVISRNDPSAHAEVMALRAAGDRLGNYRLPGIDLYVTIEPCSMCAGAMVHARVKRLFFGAPEPRAGVAVSQGNFFASPWLNHQIEVTGGIEQDACSALIRNFFRQKRR